jgi:6-phosphogluconolactonase
MTFSKKGRGAASSLLFLAMGLGLTACSGTYTIGYVYATAAKTTAGIVDGYKVDFQSGNLNALENSPTSSGGKNPVAIVATPNNKFLYVVHRDDSSVVLFAIGTDGKIYPQKTYNVTGSFPLAAAVDPAGKFLYVVFTYQNCPTGDPTCQAGSQLYTPANPGPGGMTIYPINATDSSLGTPYTCNLGRAPMGVTATNNSVYVISQDSETTANLFGFSTSGGSSSCPISALPGVTINPGNVVSTGFPASTTPGGIIADASGSHLYVTDQAGAQVIGYSIASNGVPSQVGSARTDALPMGMTFDTTGKYLYVASYSGGSLNGYTLGSNGQPVVSTVAASVQAGTGATCATVIGSPTSASPTHAVYMYTSNQLANTVSGLQLNPNDGSVIQIQNTPYAASTLPTCLVSVRSFR